MPYLLRRVKHYASPVFKCWICSPTCQTSSMSHVVYTLLRDDGQFDVLVAAFGETNLQAAILVETENIGILPDAFPLAVSWRENFVGAGHDAFHVRPARRIRRCRQRQTLSSGENDHCLRHRTLLIVAHDNIKCGAVTADEDFQRTLRFPFKANDSVQDIRCTQPRGFHVPTLRSSCHRDAIISSDYT